jgi:hypothetical protein
MLAIGYNVLLASLQRCVVRSCSVAPPFAIVAVAAKLCPFDFRRTSNQPPSDIRRTSIQLPSDVRPASCRFVPAILRPIILSSCLFIRHLFDLRSTFVRPLLDVHLTSVGRLCITGHSQERTVFFKLYVVLKFYS